MGMKQVPIGEATAAELREFARDVLGLPDIKDNANKTQLLAMIQPAWDRPNIAVSDVVDNTMANRRDARRLFADETPANHPDKVVVVLNISEEPGGTDPVQLSLNGTNLLVERGKEQTLPWPYYIILQNAVQHFHDPLPVKPGESSGGINPIPRKVHRYPFQRVA